MTTRRQRRARAFEQRQALKRKPPPTLQQRLDSLASALDQAGLPDLATLIDETKLPPG